ncbi:MAG: hypothetical protein KC422_15085 [Trueperaceae bacterium]|nr:hypothetical protein [Trueperaceae bacterium]
MTTDDWVFEAIERSGNKGASLREVQRFVDENHYEELAVDTIQTALEQLAVRGQIALEGERWKAIKKTSKEDALKKLFGD